MSVVRKEIFVYLRRREGEPGVLDGDTEIFREVLLNHQFKSDTIQELVIGLPLCVNHSWNKRYLSVFVNIVILELDNILK